jgi:hypothetical protein
MCYNIFMSKRNTKHPRTYSTRVLVGDKEVFFESTSAETIMVPGVEIWQAKKVIVGETPAALKAFEDV